MNRISYEIGSKHLIMYWKGRRYHYGNVKTTDVVEEVTLRGLDPFDTEREYSIEEHREGGWVFYGSAPSKVYPLPEDATISDR